MSEDSDDFKGRQVPISDADFHSMVTVPVIGTNGISQNLRDRLTKEEKVILVRKGQIYVGAVKKGDIYLAPDGKKYEAVEDKKVRILADKDVVITETINLWNLLGYYTQDNRLSKLTEKKQLYCRHYANLAGDLLREGCKESASCCIERVASVIEFSQSDSGFLRNLMATLKLERTLETKEPKKRGIFGGFGQKKQEGTA